MRRTVKKLAHRQCENFKNRILKAGLPYDRNSLRLYRRKNSHVGQIALVIGNGPSVDLATLEKFRGAVSFGMNQIFRIFDQTEWRPTYYALSDTLVAENFGKQILDLFHGMILASDHLRDILGPDERILYFRKDHEDYIDELPKFSENCLDVVHGGYTTAYLCMQLGWFFGIRKILTMGIDASYDFANDPVIGRLGTYDVVTPSTSGNWFIPGYFEGNQQMLVPKVKQQVMAYHSAYQFITDHSGTIHNIGKESPLDVFPKTDYKDFLP